jgi:RNA polymerase sigma-70 factor (ECF subfamily)
MATAASGICFLPTRQANDKQAQPSMSFFQQARPIATARIERRAVSPRMDEQEQVQRFRDAALPYLNDVYTLARFLLRNESDAEDAVQECYLRALRYFSSFRGSVIKPWLFAILRNVCRTEFVRRSSCNRDSNYELQMDDERVPLWQEPQPSPEAELLHRLDSGRIRQLISELPASFREALVLREINDLSYREIANVTGVPVGTVMSRLARARSLLRNAWLAEEGKPT